MAGGDDSTRRRLLDAAVACIVDEGFYRASSNRIARRAGVTWGVIQHHFGTREKLMLEVVREGIDGLVTTFEGATIEGATPAERLESLADVVWRLYCTPEFLANVQIVMNLTRDPATAAATVEALGRLGRRVEASWQGLVDQVVPPADQPPGLAKALFYILRGAAVGEELLDSMVGGEAARRSARQTASRHRAERRMLLDALSATLPNAP
jgi:AcrR family transcriptional regulator